VLSIEDDGDGTYDGQIGHAYLHLDSPTGEQGCDLGFITFMEAKIAAERHAALDVDGPIREQCDEPPGRSFLDRLLGQ
jgi:hypothetical protein